MDHLSEPPSPPGARRLLLVTAALLLLALVAVVAITRAGQGAAPAPTPSPSPPPAASSGSQPSPSGTVGSTSSPAPSPPAPSSPAPSSPAPSSPAPSPEEGAEDAPLPGRLSVVPWPGADPDWEVFVQGSSAVYRIRLATGEFTRTPLRVASAPGVGASLVVGPDALLVGSASSTAVALVPDDGPARSIGLEGTGGQPLQLLPGPEGLVWTADRGPDDTLVLQQRDLTGEAESDAVTVTAGLDAMLRPDGSGGLLLAGTGGVWQLRDGSSRRVSRGDVLATGPSAQLFADCDDVRVCSTFVRDVASGETRRIGPTEVGQGGRFAPTGQTSPGGRWATVWSPLPRPRLQVLDLATGAEVAEVAIGGNLDADLANLAVWSPDGSRLLLLDGEGVELLDPATGESRRLELGAIGSGARRLAVRG